MCEKRKLDWKRLCLAMAAAIVALTVLVPEAVDGCNEAVCASVVSKCMLTQSCKCDLSNCSCCFECSQCLSVLYTECCSCVGKQSYVKNVKF